MMHVCVGRMGVAARIYATALSMMMFSLLAMHFYLQDWSQKQAEAWVSAWEKTYHAHVGQVNLHMLRGALRLKDVGWQSGDITLDIPVLLVHGAFAGSLQQVQISDMTMREAHVQLSQTRIETLLKDGTDMASILPWASMLHRLHSAKVKALHLSVLGVENSSTLPNLDCVWSNLPYKKWTCDGHDQHHGSLHVSESGGVGHADWAQLQDKLWTQLFKMPSKEGVWRGKADWQADTLSGQATWQSSDASVKKGRWVWHAEKAGKTWQTRLYLKDAPLHMLAHNVPYLFGQPWQQGFVTGNIDMVGEVMTSDVLIFENVLFQAKNTSSLRLNHVQLSHVQLDAYSQTLQAKSMNAKGGLWQFKPLLLFAESDESSAWTVSIPNISWQDMTWQEAEHQVMLHDMYGHASWKGSSWQLNTYQSNQDGEWVITAKHDTNNQQVALEIHAKEVPLRLMRGLLPKPVQASHISGNVHLDLQGNINQARWKLQGDLVVDDFRWQDDGDVWTAKNVSFQHVLMSERQPFQIERMDVQNWTGLISIQPWLQVADMKYVEKPIDFWLGSWQVGDLHVAQGDLSIGQANQVWFHAKSMDFSPIKSGESMDVVVQGRLAEGNFQWQGQWFPWLPQPWFSAEISLQDALPFIAKDWLHLSGLPSFTQGRVSLGMTIHPNEKNKYYQGVLNVNLQHAKLEQSLFPNAPFEAMTGYAPDALFHRIARQGSFNTEKTFDDLSLEHGFQLGMLGNILLEDWMKQAQDASFQNQPMRTLHSAVSIRLHAAQRDGFKHNERVRLRKILHALQRHSKWYVILNPMLGQSTLNQAMAQNIRQTQRQIEHFLMKRGIAMSRIIPRFAEDMQRMGDMTGIQLQLMEH